MCKEANCHPNNVQIDHVVLRNFSGYEGFDPLKVFERSALKNFPNVPCKDKLLTERLAQAHKQFKNDEVACVTLKAKFLELNAERLLKEFSPSHVISKEDFLLQKFKEQLKSEKFLDEKTQQCYEAEIEKYERDFKTKFDEKVRRYGCNL